MDAIGLMPTTLPTKLLDYSQMKSRRKNRRGSDLSFARTVSCFARRRLLGQKRGCTQSCAFASFKLSVSSLTFIVELNALGKVRATNLVNTLLAKRFRKNG